MPYTRSGGRHCVVVGCRNNQKKLYDWNNSPCAEHKIQHKDCPCLLPYKFHCIPAVKNEEKRQLWIKALNRKDFNPTYKSLVCSIHFVDGRPTKENPVPSLRMGYTETKSVIAKSVSGKIPQKHTLPFVGVLPKKRRKNMSQQQLHVGLSRDHHCPPDDLYSTTESEDVGEQSLLTPETSDNDHTYCCREIPVPNNVKIYMDIDSNDQTLEDIGQSVEDDMPDGDVINDTAISENVAVEVDAFDQLFIDLSENIEKPFIVMKDDKIRVMEHYETMVRTCIVIYKDNIVELYVHNKPLSPWHSIFSEFGKGRGIKEDVIELVNKLKTAHVCIGNPEPAFISLVPEGGYLSSSDEIDFAYREYNFGAKRDTFVYYSTIRAFECELILLSKADRCVACTKTRKVLSNREYTQKKAGLQSNETNALLNSLKHSNVDRMELILKLSEQKDEIKRLQAEVNKLRRLNSKSSPSRTSVKCE